MLTGMRAAGRLDERLQRVRRSLADEGLDAFLATSDESIAYLSGFRPLQLERLFAVAIKADSSAIIVPALDLGQVVGVPEALQAIPYDTSSDGIAELLSALADTSRVGVEEDHLTWARAEALRAHGLELLSAGRIINSLRSHKDTAEVRKVKNACQLVQRALDRMFDGWLVVGASERQVNARVESWLREQGATAAHPLILFGENAANPHAEPGDRLLRAGDVVCADLSACLDGYWGDLTRCATIGPASTWARDAWQLVQEAQAAAIGACRSGVSAREIDAAQRQLIESRPDLGRCLHGAGHAIGMAVHEPPFLVPRSNTPVEEGMIFTIEPGIYRPGVGGVRLEDDVLVGRDGPELLSVPNPELIELSA